MRFASRQVRLSFVSLALACLGISVLSSFQKLGWFSFGGSTHLKIVNGVAEVRYVYATHEPISEEQFRTDPAFRTDIPNSPMPWEFNFFSNQHIGLADGLGAVSPADYWTLRLPIWTLLIAFLAIWGLAVGFRRSR